MAGTALLRFPARVKTASVIWESPRAAVAAGTRPNLCRGLVRREHILIAPALQTLPASDSIKIGSMMPFGLV